MHLFMFTNSAQRELVSICTQSTHKSQPQLTFLALVPWYRPIYTLNFEILRYILVLFNKKSLLCRQKLNDCKISFVCLLPNRLFFSFSNFRVHRPHHSINIFRISLFRNIYSMLDFSLVSIVSRHIKIYLSIF